MSASNSSMHPSFRTKALVAVASLVAVLGSASGDAAACKKNRHHCRFMQGDFTSYSVAPPECTSPVGICTMGTLVGGLPSTYYFVMDTMSWAGDPQEPTKFVYTGHSLVTDAHGHQIFGSDSGFMYISGDPTAPAPFVTTVNIVGGTHQYKNAHGSMVATGNLVFATGLAVGTYTADICR